MIHQDESVSRDRIRPESAQDAEEFSALLRSLKKNSGRTLRQLEEQAAIQGAVLPRSTVADMLRRGALPRPELLAVFVRACGDGQYLAEWLSVRERLAVGPHLDQAPAAPATEPDADPIPHGTERRRTWVITAVLTAVAAAVAAVAWWPRTGIDRGVTSTSVDTPVHPEVLPLPSAGSWVRIRPAKAPDLCLTEGREHTGRYDSAVAVLRPCAEPAGPRVFLQPDGTELATIKWESPINHVMGCLTVVETGFINDMLEPQDNCIAGKSGQLFHIEHVGDRHYRLRTPGSDLCIGLRENLTVVDTEALRQPCAPQPDQEFLIDLTSGDQPNRPAVRLPQLQHGK
ncbi:hypothetical protein SAMN05216215_10456 [Saccharopolyspora shandongensis]|uniref:XRE family transcriptional regulator n=1 Tax=Saccharopolyspora shandongensis TaxID=418495 RepID=A0A1H3Q135_9PSEU|nr:helix-turn-helix domain-containing protein [Saccharopolyspora shandongensis]SDZ06943.1 hypothetical protein SAMN05216215_10456 [Saccharopolyspora shandongensis]